MSAAVFSQPKLHELSVSAVRQGQEIVVSAWVHNPADGPAFTIVDLLEDVVAPRDLLGGRGRTLRRTPAAVQTAMWGISLPAEGGRVQAGFTVSVMLGLPPHPEGAAADDPLQPEPGVSDGTEVGAFTLDGHLGQRRSGVIQSPPINGRSVPLLTMTYVAGTPHGLLAVAFATPHIDDVDIFRALFDRIAASVRIVSGGPVTLS